LGRGQPAPLPEKRTKKNRHQKTKPPPKPPTQKPKKSPLQPHPIPQGWGGKMVLITFFERGKKERENGFFREKENREFFLNKK